MACPKIKPAGSPRAKWQRLALCVGAGFILLLAGCATPIHVERADPRDVNRELTTNVISTGKLSNRTEIVLRQYDLAAAFAWYPEQTISTLHRIATAGRPDPDLLFALAELSFKHAEDSGKRSYYLSASVYAYAFLFPDDPALRPSGFDPRLRTASNIYNRGLTSAFASADRSRVDLQSGRTALPFGSIDVTFDAASANWDGHALSNFTPADELHITGLQNRYRYRGIGAPLAADVADGTDPANDSGFKLESTVKVPVTALMRMNASQQALAQGNLSGRIDIYPAFEPSDVEIRGQKVPLEVDTSAAFAYGLSDPKIWASETAGFLRGDYLKGTAPLGGLEPYRPGQIPVVFIHGTASSSGRWADLANDLQSDPVIRDHFQFWWFTYDTGNPVPFSALRLRKAIEAAVQRLDPEGKDPTLRQAVLIGHSQGGLLAKFLVIDSGSRLWDAVSTKPVDQLPVSDQTRQLLRQAVFVKPVPEVTRVIFISTPQHGSYVAGSRIGQFFGRLVTLPVTLMSSIGETFKGNMQRPGFAPRAFTSVWSMTPDNPALQTFAEIPIAPNVATNSIIPVLGDGPFVDGDDGVVTYKSAHIDGVESELVIQPAAHSVQANPRTVAEVRRILLLHLAKVCPQGCKEVGPAPMAALTAASGPRRSLNANVSSSLAAVTAR
jgi:hypothetical protein